MALLKLLIKLMFKQTFDVQDYRNASVRNALFPTVIRRSDVLTNNGVPGTSPVPRPYHRENTGSRPITKVKSFYVGRV